jgi:hypothetical protein
MDYPNYKLSPISIETEFDTVTPHTAMPLVHKNDSVANEALKEMNEKCGRNYNRFECERAIKLYNVILKTRGYK